MHRKDGLMKKHIYRRINKYAISQFTKLNPDDFVIGDNQFNLKCHLNSVQKVKEGKADKVILCYAYDRSDHTQCIHFINQLDNGKYQDNTWEWIYQWCDYYMIKEVSPSEQDHIWDSLQNMRESIVNINSSWFERFIFKIKYEKVI
jgi:hypothetical protein